MQIKYRLLSVLLVVLLVSGLFCSSQGRAIPDTQSGNEWTSEKETIYIWYADDSLSNYITSAAVEFGEKQGARIIPVLKSASAFMEEINADTMDPEKQTPDAYVINNDELEKAFLAGLASEINDSGEKVNEAFFPKTALSAVTYLGKKVAYPFYFETSVLLYNKDYVTMWLKQQAEKENQDANSEDGSEVVDADELMPESTDEISLENIIDENGIPITVDGLLGFADTFDAPENMDGVMKWNVADIFYNYWIVGAYLSVGGDCGDDADQVDIYNNETVECLKVYQALNQFFFIEPDAVNYESAINDFIEGKIVFSIANTDIMRRLKEAKEDGSFGYSYGVATLPRINEQLGSRALSVTNTVAINGYSEHKELANRFALFLTQEYASNLYEQSGKLSSTIAANQKDPNCKVFIKQYEESISLPKLMEIGDLWLKLEALFAKVWNGEDVDSLVKDLSESVKLQEHGKAQE